MVFRQSCFPIPIAYLGRRLEACVTLDRHNLRIVMGKRGERERCFFRKCSSLPRCPNLLNTKKYLRQCRAFCGRVRRNSSWRAGFGNKDFTKQFALGREALNAIASWSRYSPGHRSESRRKRPEIVLRIAVYRRG